MIGGIYIEKVDKAALTIKSVVAVVGGFIAYFLGGIDTLLQVLLVLLVIDYLAGVLKAVHQKELSSEIGFKGLAKKVGKLLVIAVAYLIDIVTGGVIPLREMVIFFFITNEAISILENVAVLGVPLPEKLKDTLIQLREGKK